MSKRAMDLNDFRDSGLLWLINTSVLHPRGYAMAMIIDSSGDAIGGEIQGDGSEPWTFGETLHDQFQAVNRLLSGDAL